MPREILLSQLGGQQEAFEKAVVDHIVALHAFSAQRGKPRPAAHPLVEQSIKRLIVPGKPDKHIPDYVIVDDLPPPEERPAPTLEAKKNILHQRLTVAEHEAKYKILPQRKIRMANVKMQIAMATPEDDRTGEQREDIASYLHVQDQWRKIDLIAAQAESDIDDLTEETVDNWELPSFG